MSYYTAVSPEEKEDQRRGAITSAIIHSLLILLVLWPFLTPPNPPPGQAGVLVSFAEPDAGEVGGDVPTSPPVSSTTEPIAEAVPEEPVEETKPEKVKPAVKEKPEPVKRPVKEVTTDKNSRERALAKKKAAAKKEADRKLKKARAAAAKEAQDAKDKIAKAKADAKRIADAKAAEAKRIADEKAALADKYRKLGTVDGSGGGNNDNPGNAGQQNGDPSGEALDGISTGSGVLGGGIAGRKIVGKPSINDRSQNTGTVNVKVCVDSEGNVMSAKYTQAGSTTANSSLIAKAVAGARKYKFDKNEREAQCGTIKINFKLQ